MNEELKVIISAEINDLKKNISEAKKNISSLGDTGSKLKTTMGKVTSGVGKAFKVGFTAAAAATAAVGASMVVLGKSMAKNITQTAEYGDNIDKMSQKMNLSAEGYQEWDFVLQHCGTSIDAMKAPMKTLATAAEKGNDAFAKLGISQKDIANMSQEELFGATIKGLQNVTDDTERTYLAGQLLGRGATELGAVFNMSADEVEAMKQQLHDMGGVMSNEAVAASAAFEDSLQNVKTAIGGAKNTIFSQFLPACTSAMDGVTMIFSGDIDGGIKKIKKGITDFINTASGVLPKVIKVGGSIVTALISAIAQNLPQIMKCGVQLVQELVAGIIQNIPNLIKGVTTLFNEVVRALPQMVQVIVSALPTIIPQLISGLTSMITTLCGQFNSIIAPIIQALPAIVTAIVSSLITNLPTLINGVIQLALGIVGAVNQIIAVLVPMIPTIIVQIVAAIIKCIPQVIAGVLKLVQGIAKTVKTWYSSWFKGIGKALGDIAKKIGEALTNIVTAVKQKFQQIKDSISEKVEAAKSAVKEKFQAIKDSISEKVEAAKTAVKEKFEAIKSGIAEKVEAVKTKVKSVFDAVKTAITNPVETAKNMVKNMIDKIKGFFNFKWSLPKLKLPHFSVSGKFSLNPPSIPKFGISWYKLGGVFDSPTLFPYGNGAIGGLGEDGAEAVVPLEKNTQWLDKIAERLAAKAGSTPIVLQVDGKTFAETSIRTINDLTKLRGNLPLKIM